uniref:Reverse transcriptase zinc-binding domain-containing protein n=1 Tax=Solanum lycopersicum TaxID=4081 RepID=A0A3Q7JAY2_SOLLC
MGMNEAFYNCFNKIWLMWTNDINITILQDKEQHVHIKVDHNSCSSFDLSVVYAKCSEVLRRELWDDLITMAANIHDPWGVIAILTLFLPKRKKLEDVGFTGLKVTWGDHRDPLHTIWKRFNMLPTMINFWADHPNFLQTVQNNWNITIKGNPLTFFNGKSRSPLKLLVDSQERHLGTSMKNLKGWKTLSATWRRNVLLIILLRTDVNSPSIKGDSFRSIADTSKAFRAKSGGISQLLNSLWSSFMLAVCCHNSHPSKYLMEKWTFLELESYLRHQRRDGVSYRVEDCQRRCLTLDRVIWKLSNSGQFSSASTWDNLRQIEEVNNFYGKLWRKEIPFKMAFLVWRVINNKLSTDDRVAWMDIAIEPNC